MKNKIKKFALGLAVAGVVVVGAGAAVPTEAALFGSGDDTDLGDLIILDQLFSGGVFNGGTSTGRTVVVQPGDTLSGIAAVYLGNANLWPSIASQNNLANPDLIFPGQVLALPTAGIGSSEGIFNGGNNLGDLFILSELFGGGDILGGGDTDLGDLFILQSLFGNGTGNLFNGSNGGIFGGDLGQLIILNELFGGSGGIFD
ncbi:MAG: hypothetical protein A2365_03105 [Candidatus Nealsonbacteria bacterium RIFOXYB1_FULL_40_15]|uniref:LysM domain-containing protein n=2 Tax=Candidatus Nealsoniibacteriota TaxID=1817911 RepID=A0A1G2ETP0_9BACT|nr:MAG: hypothetical protein A2365_03105 [Candidatus Nealsonbacteria bacterium RIFOXYB1_FULL_40_15]OGZ29215.1 MAG: hypothetical protein A2427_02965 [Candidatus Nealsonbacteria bacterium RIFOXYC1_FULL_40_7]OGZ29898.1 MAG: hypothetical protein A2562_02140 [Candidatus Nealsonbacteria bacterium RIFOXYD1_FULL_39_11]